MFKNRLPHLVMLVSVLILLGCSHGTPIEPGLDKIPSITTPNSISDGRPANRYLWGVWNADYDPTTNNFVFEPVRGAAFHLNVVGRLQAPNPPGLGVKLNAIQVTAGTVDLDITLTHPSPNTNFRGFDVRGIVMGSGNVIQSKYDSTIAFTDSQGTRLTNADGYTRWWNYTEFTTPGLFGFVRGAIGSQSFNPVATLNPFKYYADFLQPTGDIIPWVSIMNRGTFSTVDSKKNAMKVTRNYKLKFPIVGGIPKFAFQYAVDANWAPPIGISPTPKPVSDFPPEANCPEAFYVTVDTSGSTTFYNSSTDAGGDLNLKIEVFDWGSTTQFSGIDGEIQAIKVESPTLFDGVVDVPVTHSQGSELESGIYTVAINGVHPTGLRNQETLITIVSKNPSTYQPPAGGWEYPQSAALAAYALASVPVIGTDKIIVTSPNGGEIWAGGSKHDITWENVGDPGSTVSISYNESDGISIPIEPSAPNTGRYSWNSLPLIESAFLKVKIISNDDPSIFDESDKFFTIGKAGLRVISPNGGETLPGGGSWDIRWTDTSPVSNVKIELSTNGSSSSNFKTVIVYTTPDDGLYTWEQIPVLDTTKGRIRISDALDSTSKDISDNNFKIVSNGLTIAITQPNGGEKVTIGQPYEIKWNYTGTLSNVMIDLSTDSGDSFPNIIADNTECDGSYILDSVPEMLATNSARVRITTIDSPIVQDVSDLDFSIVKAAHHGWYPATGQKLVPLDNPAPYQGDNPVDLAVFSLGGDQSRGEIVNHYNGSTFHFYNDDYTSPIGASWLYPNTAVMARKFDILQDGTFSFTALAGSDAWAPPSINDPIYGFFSASNTSTGDTTIVYMGDGADSGNPDPDQVAWSWIPDFSCGVPGGQGDTTGYFFRVYSPKAGNPVAHNGTVGLLQWTSPFAVSNVSGWNLKMSTQGGGYGPIDDTDPSKMALAVDDNSGLALNGKPATIYWILDSAGQAHAIAIAMEIGANLVMNVPLSSEQYGSRKPVDIEMVNARDFGYTVTDPGFNWLAALLDNQDGTWSVGVWEYNYLLDIPAFTNISITDPIEGTPMSMDVDGHDFEIHVLSKSGDTVKATVFEYSK